jgi:hypothetical protein
MAYVRCIDNTGYPASLERGKRYQLIRDDKAAERGLLRVVDESGDSYLYPSAFFERVSLSQSIAKAVKEGFTLHTKAPKRGKHKKTKRIKPKRVA